MNVDEFQAHCLAAFRNGARFVTQNQKTMVRIEHPELEEDAEGRKPCPINALFQLLTGERVLDEVGAPDPWAIGTPAAELGIEVEDRRAIVTAADHKLITIKDKVEQIGKQIRQTKTSPYYTGENERGRIAKLLEEKRRWQRALELRPFLDRLVLMTELGPELDLEAELQRLEQLIDRPARAVSSSLGSDADGDGRSGAETPSDHGCATRSQDREPLAPTP